MRIQSRINRESFQELLANAYAVQESGLDAQSLSAVVELQRSIATGEPDVDRAMNLIADRVRNVSHAAGVAIALMQADRLVYRAGGGRAAAFVGRHMTAILGVSEARGEILRVENAQTDTRIEADVCRQFEAQALLILPIYQEHSVAGVLEVLFDEAHVFEDGEVRTYRLMTRLVEEAMFRKLQSDQQKAVASQPVAVPQATSPLPAVRAQNRPEPEPSSEPWTDQVWRPVTEAAAAMAGFFEQARQTVAFTERLNHVFRHQRQWNLAVGAVVAGLLIAASWITFGHRPASLATSTPQAGPSAADRPIAAAAAITENSQPSVRTVVPKTEATKASNPFKRVRVGANEVDYISEDVTIRHFTPTTPTPRMKSGYKQVDFGKDVTVRYFGLKPTVVSQTQPLPAEAPSATRSLSESK